MTDISWGATNFNNQFTNQLLSYVIGTNNIETETKYNINSSLGYTAIDYSAVYG